MIEKKNVKKLAWVAVALVIMVLSMTVVSKAASNPENHKKTIEALDEKKADILKLTATSAAASTAIAAIPGDATTPIANKLTDLIIFSDYSGRYIFGKVFGDTYRICNVFYIDSGSVCFVRGRNRI